MKKEQYDEPVMNLCFDGEDVIRTSNTTEPLPIGDGVF